MKTLSRHCAILLLAILLTYLFLVVHSNWAPIHRWNRAFADASLVLVAAAMAIGPAVRIRGSWNWIVPWRRELGVHGIVLGAVHVFLVLDGWIAWDIPRVIGFLNHPLFGGYVLADHGFGLANILGVLALAYGAVLLSISNDYAVRRLGGSVWKHIQLGAYVLWALVVIHTAYFLFMHFLHFDRPVPQPNPLQLPFLGLVVVVAALRLIATARTWRSRRNDSSSLDRRPHVEFAD